VDKKMPYDAEKISEQIEDLGKAIAFAEGFGILGAVPTRAHNPGDLKLHGYPTTGEENISVFDSDNEGWHHLYDQLIRIKFSRSHVYNLSMTFTEFASHWTDTSQSSWLNNVIFKLTELDYVVNENTTLGEFFSSKKGE